MRRLTRPRARARAGRPARATSLAWGGAAALAALVIAAAHAGCGADTPDYFVVPYEAGVDAEAGQAKDAEPDFDPTLGGPCTEDAQCDDDVPCTYDVCDAELSRCRNIPDDAQCDDGVYCNGRERCVPRRGCAPGPPVTCQDGDVCTIDRCVEETRSCEHLPRDADGDGDPDDHCAPKRDCDDTDPTVSSLAAEICGNFKDDDCDGLIDEEPCVMPANDVCETALAVTAPGTFHLSTLGTKKDYPTSCGVEKPMAARDIVVAITVPPGGPHQDVLVRATTSAPSNEVAVALQTACGQAASEIGCGHVTAASSARAIARSVAPGDTVFAVVTTQTESAVDLRVDMPAATTRPTNETCAAPEPVAVDVPFSVSLVDATRDLASGCDRAKTGELTYSFTLAEPRDVRIFASTVAGIGAPVVSMRGAACEDELRCRVGSTPPVFARSLPAGTHVFSVAGTTQIDANVVVKTYPPTEAPPNQSCATAPVIAHNSSIMVDLADQEDAIHNGCHYGGPSAAYELVLTERSDVLIIGRFPLNEGGAVSLSGPECSPSDLRTCSSGVTPQRVSRRNLPAGSYRVVIADELGLPVGLSVLVRPTVPPVTVTANDCAAPFVIPEGGGYFTGDTTDMTADFTAGCDALGQPGGGANDQLLRLELSARRRVVFDMSGSTLTTLLNLRKGEPCPGIEIPETCNVGGGPNRSFLDRTLDPGSYWVQVDGFAGAAGPWNLDVRVLPP